jgi:pimeloyl-ACP methyl ester carboxylesterase
MKVGMRGLMALLLLAVAAQGCALIEAPITGRMSAGEPLARPYLLETKTVMVNDVSISYEEAGQGPDLILIHGGVIPISTTQSLFMADAHLTAFSFLTVLGLVTPLAQSTMHTGAVSVADTWNYNLKELATKYHVIAIDLPGFGGSDKPSIDYTVEEFADYLDGFIDAKQLQKPSLLGHGLGGMIAMCYGLQHPEKIDKLILVDSFGAFGPAKWHQKHSALNLPRGMMKFWQKEKAAKINVLFPLYNRMVGNWEGPKRQVTYVTLSPKAAYDYNNESGRLILSREGNSGEFIEAVADFKIAYIGTEEARKEVHACHLALLDTRRKDFKPEMPKLQVPVLIIHGAYDPVVRLEEAQFMNAAIPHSQLVTYTLSAHYPMVEQAEQFNQDVMFFLSGQKLPAVAGSEKK